MHFAAAIIRAIMQKRFADARKLKLQKTKPGYETSEALSDEVRPRLEHLQTLLTTRLEELIDDKKIDNCEISMKYRTCCRWYFQVSFKSLKRLSVRSSP